MTKQRTDNLGLPLLDDVDTDSFYADWVDLLNRVNNADKQRQADIAGETARAETAETGLAGSITSLQAYIDALIQSRALKDPVRAVSTSNITLSGLQTIDGVSLVGNDRVLVAGQSTGSQNGIYVVASGAWSRATDADTSSEMKPGLIVTVQEGSAYNRDVPWELAMDAPITLGTTALVFSKLGGGYFVAKDAQPYSVLDHGAKFDGSTDDTSAINTLGAAVSAAGGGRLYFPPLTGVIKRSSPGNQGSGLISTHRSRHRQLKRPTTYGVVTFQGQPPASLLSQTFFPPLL